MSDTDKTNKDAAIEEALEAAASLVEDAPEELAASLIEGLDSPVAAKIMEELDSDTQAGRCLRPVAHHSHRYGRLLSGVEPGNPVHALPDTVITVSCGWQVQPVTLPDCLRVCSCKDWQLPVLVRHPYLCSSLNWRIQGLRCPSDCFALSASDRFL